MACLKGAQAALADDIIVFMDGDGADDPAAIATLVAPIRAGTYDFVIASRARGAREPGSMAWHQLAAGHIAGVLTRLLYGVRYTDMCAFRAIRRDTLLALGMRELTYGWNLEMQMRVARARLARVGSAGRLSSPPRRAIQGGRELARLGHGRRENHLDLRARGDGARARAYFLARYIATLRKKPSTLPRKSAAAFSTAWDAIKTVSAELCMSAIAVETRCRTETTDLVPDAAAATLLEI